MRENELVVKVKVAKEQLESAGRVTTQVAVAALIGVKPQSLMRYPKVRALLPVLKNASRLRSVQASLSEEKLLLGLEQAIQQLEERGVNVTIPRVCADIGVTPLILRRYPLCITVVKKAIKDQKRRQFERQEDELLQKIHEIMHQLKESKLTITVSAISKAVHRSPGSLKYYPRIRLICEQIVKGHLDTL